MLLILLLNFTFVVKLRAEFEMNSLKPTKSILSWREQKNVTVIDISMFEEERERKEEKC